AARRRRSVRPRHRPRPRRRPRRRRRGPRTPPRGRTRPRCSRRPAATGRAAPRRGARRTGGRRRCERTHGSSRQGAVDLRHASGPLRHVTISGTDRGGRRREHGEERPPRAAARPAADGTAAAARVRPVDGSAGGRRPAAEPAAGSGDAARQGGGDAAGAPSARLPRRRARTVELPRPVPAPPTDAVHSLSAEDPRPLPRPLRIADEEIRSVGVGGLRTEQIVQTVADPQDAWTADAGTSDHFLRGEVVVQVRRADNAVIGLFSTRYALSVRPAEYEPALDIADE